MSERKYMSEFGLNMLSDKLILLQQDSLEQIDQSKIDPHIYIIARRPKITLDSKSIVFTDNKVTGIFKKQVKEKILDIPFEAVNNLGTSKATLKCEYPCTEYHIEDVDNKVIAKGKCALLLGEMGTKYYSHLDLEVLYVGQSYGKNGSRKASERLTSHSTLQKIYAEAIKNSPDQDIWLILCRFSQMLLSCFDGRNEFQATMKEDEEHFKKVLSAAITEQQQINFTEAALIRYFRPIYNKIYKDSFPNPAHSTYSECYDIDINMVCVELQTESIRGRLWSENSPANWIHFCKFPLHSREERKYMFDF